MVAGLKKQRRLLRKEFPVGLAHQLSQRTVKLGGPGLVAIDVAALVVPDEGRHRRVVQEQPETILPGAQLRLRLLPTLLLCLKQALPMRLALGGGDAR
jgi:hypothetical protein